MPNKDILAIILTISLFIPQPIQAITKEQKSLFSTITHSYQTFIQDAKDLINPKKQCTRAQKRRLLSNGSWFSAIVIAGLIGIKAGGKLYTRLFVTMHDGSDASGQDLELIDLTKQPSQDNERFEKYIASYIDAIQKGEEPEPLPKLQKSLQRTQNILGISSADWDRLQPPDDYSGDTDNERLFLEFNELLTDLDKNVNRVRLALQEETLSLEEAKIYLIPYIEAYIKTIFSLEELAPKITDVQTLFADEDSASESEESADSD